MKLDQYRIQKAKVVQSRFGKIKDKIFNLKRKLEWNHALLDEMLRTMTEDEKKFFYSK